MKQFKVLKEKLPDNSVTKYLLQKLKEEDKTSREKFIEMIEKAIEHRDNERKNNNIFRKGSNELNDDFIDDLEELKSKLKEEIG